MLQRIKKEDVVVVVAGRDRGKSGHVIMIDTHSSSVVVKGVSLQTKHVKARKQGEKSRIVKEEGKVPLCKVMPVCPSCKRPCRVQTKVLEDKKLRSCHRCKETF